MPELPEVQTIIDDLRKRVIGNRITNVSFITPSVWRNDIPGAGSLIDAEIVGLERKGKHILLHLSNSHTLVIHLKMTGKLIACDSKAIVPKHTHFVLKFTKQELRFNDIRRFGFLDYIPSSDLPNVGYLANLGPDALEIRESEFVLKLKSKKRAVKAVLLDQETISGLGNIYSDEALFAAAVRPSRIASGLSSAKLKTLHACVINILQTAIKARGSSVSDYVDATGLPGSYQNYHKVYGRGGLPCYRCGSSIKKQIIGGRSSHYCGRCQR